MVLQNGINANATTPLLPVQGGSGVSSPTAHGILVAEGASSFNPITLTNGQLLIGSTGADPSAASLTAGSGITITPGAGSISIAATGTPGVLAFVDVTGTTQAMAVNTSYLADNASLVTLTLPTTAAQGTVIEVGGNGAGGWIIAQNSGQLINFGNQVTTTGTGGSIASTNRYDQIRMLCTVANTSWVVKDSQGNLTVT